MKKFSFLCLFALVMGLSGCKQEVFFPNQPIPEVDEKPAPTVKEKEITVIPNEYPAYIIEDEVIDPSIPNGYTITSSDYNNGQSILSITPTYEGLLIHINHPSEWIYNTIHVINKSTGYENARLVDFSADVTEVLYPFVKAGQSYEVYIEKQENGWTNWGTSNHVYVDAVGGLGNVTVLFDKYTYDEKNYILTFKNLTYVKPDLNPVSTRYSGSAFQGALWSGNSIYGLEYSRDKSQIVITGNTSFLDKQEKIALNLDYIIEYKGWRYSTNMLSQVIYQGGSPMTLPLSGGKKIPSVYLEGSVGWQDGTAIHFGDEWTDLSKMTIRIVDEENPDNNLVTTNVMLKDRGNSTKWTPKVPYSLKFDTKTKVLGMKKSKRWVLMANYLDRSLIRTQLASYIGNNIFNSYWNASFHPVNLYINGKFVGTYDLGESNKVEKNRVNVQSLEDYADGSSDFVDVNGDGKVNIEDAGFMVEIDTATNWSGTLNKYNYKTEVGIWNGAERIYFYSAGYGIPMTLKDPDFGSGEKYSDEECRTYGKYAKSKIDAFEKMLMKSDFKYKYAAYIDVYSFADWYLLNEFGKNSDANFQKSVPVTYNPSTGKLYMGPNWDFDLAFGNFNHGYDLIGGGYSTVDDPTGWYIYGGKKGCDENGLYIQLNGKYVQTWWINRLMQSASFKKLVKNRWMVKRIELKNAINEIIPEYANRISDYIPMNEARLPRLGVSEWNGPSGFEQRTEYGDEIYYLYNWCMARYNWMDNQIKSW